MCVTEIMSTMGEQERLKRKKEGQQDTQDQNL